MDLVAAPPQSKDLSPQPRRNSISIPIANHRSTLASDDLELLPVKPASHSYSSLKDLLPPVAVNSSKPKPALPGPEIRIRNLLVKQAAWAYLRPMSTALGSTDGNFFHRSWTRVASFIDFLCRNFIRVIDVSLPGIRIRIRSSTLQRSKMCFV